MNYTSVKGIELMRSEVNYQKLNVMEANEKIVDSTKLFSWTFKLVLSDREIN